MARNRARHIVGVLAGIAAAGAFAAADGIAGTRATTVNVSEKEWVVIPSVRSVRAGRITFRVRNTGRLPHEFVVVRTNRAPGALPVRGQRAVTTGLVGAIGRFRNGLRGLSVTLRPGRYVLLCNLPGHYRAGQYTGLRVR